MQEINFSSNWNGKLNCQSFTTFRFWNEEKYRVDEIYRITFRDIEFKAKILRIQKMKLSAVDEWIARLDTGYSLEEFKKAIRIIYQDRTKNVEKADFALILLLKSE